MSTIILALYNGRTRTHLNLDAVNSKTIFNRLFLDCLHQLQSLCEGSTYLLFLSMLFNITIVYLILFICQELFMIKINVLKKSSLLQVKLLTIKLVRMMLSKIAIRYQKASFYFYNSQK